MNEELLEKLLIDRAVGELPPETEALLDAYLASHPNVADHAREIEQTLALARQVLRTRPSPSLPRFPSQHLAQEQIRLQRRQWRLNVLKLAAVLVLGVGLGWFVAGHGRWTSPTLASAPPVPPAPPATAAFAHGTASRFWSIQSFQAAARVRSTHSLPAWSRSSPGRQFRPPNDF